MSHASRRGFSALLAVVALVVLLTALGSYRLTRSRRALGNVHRAQLRLMARLQGQSALQELLAEICRDANDPGARLHRKIREVIDGDWDELELTPVLLGPEITLVPTWGREGRTPRRGNARGEIESFSARIRSAASNLDPQGSEEWLGVLTLEVTVTMRDAAGEVTRRLEENYEVRTLRAGVPRPFDQLGMYLGHLDAVTIAREGNKVRQRLIRRAAALKDELSRMDTRTWPVERADYLKKVAEGMPDLSTLQRATPLLPVRDSALMGFYHVDAVPLAQLNLVTHWKQAELRMLELEKEYRQAKGDPETLVRFAYQLAGEYSNALDAAWGFQRVMTLLPRDSIQFRKEVEVHLERLTPEYFLDRAHLAPTRDDPDLAAWLKGETRLEGVVDASGLETRLRLTGELSGRVVLIVGGDGAVLEEVNREGFRQGNSLTVVSLGGDVELRGRSGASVIMLGPAGALHPRPGHLDVHHGATLHGSLILPHSRAPQLDLDGALVFDAGQLAPWPPHADLARPFRGSYVVAVSPEPLFRTGAAR